MGHQPNPWRDAPPWAKEFRNMCADIQYTLDLILELQVITMGIIQNLEEGVAAQTTVVGGFETFVSNLLAAREAAGHDEAKLTAIDTALKSNTTRLGALLAANTAAAPEAVASPAAPEITQ